jgi:NAD(P)-dependent dehydrogenase (short-subunit alcohol dehydrogenase family)
MAERTPIDLSSAMVAVTGAGSGIGRATALAFAALGADVACVDINPEAAEKTAVACNERGGRGLAYQVDVSDRDAMFELAERIHREHRPLDVLVNNAGVGMTGRFLDTSLADWDWILSINLMGVLHGCYAFGPAMVAQRRGHVVNMSSGLGYTPTATESGYGTTKAAVLQLSRALRADWHSSGVGVSAVCPGVIDTAIISRTRFRGDAADPDSVSRTERLFRRGHSPEIVARAVIQAVRTNRSVKPAGIEASFGWWLQKFAPTAATDLLARLPVLR